MAAVCIAVVGALDVRTVDRAPWSLAGVLVLDDLRVEGELVDGGRVTLERVTCRSLVVAVTYRMASTLVLSHVDAENGITIESGYGGGTPTCRTNSTPGGGASLDIAITVQQCTVRRCLPLSNLSFDERTRPACTGIAVHPIRACPVAGPVQPQLLLRVAGNVLHFDERLGLGVGPRSRRHHDRQLRRCSGEGRR